MQNQKSLPEINIYSSTKDKFTALAACIFIIVLGLVLSYFIYDDVTKHYGLWSENILMLGVSGFLIVAGIWGSSNMLRTRNNKDPEVVVSTEGFKTKSLDSQWVTWDQVTDITIGTMASESFVCIDLVDTDAYLEKLSKGKRFEAKSNLALGYPAISLGTKLLGGYDTETLYATMLKYWEHAKKQQMSVNQA